MQSILRRTAVTLRLVLALFICGGVRPSADVAAEQPSSVWFSRFLEHRQAFYNGDGFLNFDYRANDRFPNDQADLLESFLYAYRYSGEREWLDEFVRQSTNVLARVDDLSGDALRGWETPRYSQNLVRNTRFGDVQIIGKEVLETYDFEDVSTLDSTLPAGWSRVQSSSDTVFRLESAGIEGTAAVLLRSDGINWVTMEHVFNNHTEGETYYFEVWAKTDTPEIFPQLDCRVGGDYLAKTKHLEFSGQANEWIQLGITFTAPAPTDGPLVIGFYPVPLAGGATILLDNGVFGRVTDSAPAHWAISGTGTGAVRLEPDSGTVSIASAIRPDSIEQILHNPHVSDNWNYEPGILYNVSCEMFTSQPSVGGSVQVVDVTQTNVLASIVDNNTGWSTNTVEFRAPMAVGHQLVLRLNGGQTGAAGTRTVFRQPQVKQFANHVVDDGLLLNVFLEFSNLVRHDDELWGRFGALAREFVELAVNITRGWERDWIEKEGIGSYLVPDDGSQRVFARASLPLNQFAAAGLVHLRCHDFNGDPFHLDRAVKMGKAMIEYLKPNGDGYRWPYYKELFPEQAREIAFIPSREEDLSHGNLDVMFAIELYRRQLVMEDEHMGRLLRTFLGQVFNGNPSAPGLSGDVSGLSQAVDALPAIWWWLELSALHPEVLRVATLSVERFADIDASGPIHSELGVWYDQGWRILLKAMLAYYHSLAERQMLGPTLRLEKVSDGIEVSWAAWYAGYVLETTPQLRRTWATAVSGPVIRNGRYVATSKDLAGPLFFRLFKD